MFICVLQFCLNKLKLPPMFKFENIPFNKRHGLCSEVGPLFSESTMNLNTLYKKLTGEQFSLVCEALGKFNK